MGWLVTVLGGLLATLGATVIKLGLDIAVRDERGWTQVISGSVGLSGGIITIALGLLLMRLGAIRQDLRRQAARSLLPEIMRSSGFDGETDAFAAPPPRGAPVSHSQLDDLGPSAGSSSGIEGGSFASAQSESGDGVAAYAAAPMGEVHSGFEHVPADGGHHVSPPGIVGAPTATSEYETSAASAAPAAQPPEKDQSAQGHVVVGQYEANGVSYVMYADGSIEADTPSGLYRFGSIVELKRFIEGNHPTG